MTTPATPDQPTSGAGEVICQSCGMDQWGSLHDLPAAPAVSGDEVEVRGVEPVGPLADKVLAELDGYDDAEKADILAVRYVTAKQWGQEQYRRVRAVEALRSRYSERYSFGGSVTITSVLDELRAVLSDPPARRTGGEEA